MHEADQIQAKVISQTPEMIHQIIQSFSTENGETSFDESFQRFEVHYDLTEEEFQFIKIHLTYRIIDLDFSSFNLLRDSSKLAYYLLMNNLNDNLR
jgi:hypothetical protein